MPCKIVDFVGSDTYGKFPLDGAEDTIIMEWKYWLNYMSRYLNELWSDN